MRALHPHRQSASMPTGKLRLAEMKPPGNAGVPPAPHWQVVAHLLSLHSSTGKDANTLLRPSPWRSRRQGGRAPNRGETEWHATGVHAGGTPAFPGGASPWDSASAKPVAFRPARRSGATSQEAERLAAAVHAGGTPALPGGAASQHSCSSRGQEPTCKATLHSSLTTIHYPLEEW